MACLRSTKKSNVIYVTSELRKQKKQKNVSFIAFLSWGQKKHVNSLKRIEKPSFFIRHMQKENQKP